MHTSILDVTNLHHQAAVEVIEGRFSQICNGPNEASWILVEILGPMEDCHCLIRDRSQVSLEAS